MWTAGTEEPQTAEEADGEQKPLREVEQLPEPTEAEELMRSLTAPTKEP